MSARGCPPSRNICLSAVPLSTEEEVMETKYLVVLPAFNEEATIGRVLAEIKADVPFAGILVINDGSTDGTGIIAAGEGAMVITHPFNLGYGAALQTGFRFASAREYSFVLTMDADGQHISSSVQNLIKAMEEHEADIVIGSRFIGSSYPVGLLRKIGIRLFAFIARTYTGIDITDPTSGFQLLNRPVFSFLADGDNYPLDYPDVNIIMALHKRRFKITEAPVAMTESRSGKSMHSGLSPVLYVIKMALAIIMVILRRTGR